MIRTSFHKPDVLCRVEDDDNHSSFPFNSCGTAAYVAPEALICNKKVNSSVDVYAYGILMWEVGCVKPAQSKRHQA
jgi:serine/threonine protein kinase